MLSSLALTGLVTAVALKTGGISSFAAIWLVVVPLEAALSASRRVVAVASTFALGAAGFCCSWATFGLSPRRWRSARAGRLAALGIISASLYATGLALGAEVARAHELLAALCRGGPLSPAGPQHDRRHHPPRPQRRGAVRLAGGRAAVRRARCSDLLGHGLFDRVHVADRPAYLTALARCGRAWRARSVEFRVRRDAAEGGRDAAIEFIWVEMRCRPLDGGDGATTAEREVVAVMRDITERKAQEQALEEARAEAERANAAKSRFLATMSHELRTPLNAIIGFSEMLMNEEHDAASTPRGGSEYAQLINDSGHHLLSVVNGILDMSKIETGDFEITPEPFAPGQVISNCCDLLALQGARGRASNSSCAMPTICRTSSPTSARFKQIMLNLLSNAIKFTKPRRHRSR